MITGAPSISSSTGIRSPYYENQIRRFPEATAPPAKFRVWTRYGYGGTEHQAASGRQSSSRFGDDCVDPPRLLGGGETMARGDERPQWEEVPTGSPAVGLNGLPHLALRIGINGQGRTPKDGCPAVDLRK